MCTIRRSGKHTAPESSFFFLSFFFFFVFDVLIFHIFRLLLIFCLIFRIHEVYLT